MRKALLVGIAIFLVDFLTKMLTEQFIPLMSTQSPIYPYGGIGVFENFLGIEFSITHVMNKGAAWGTFASFQIYLLFLRIAVIIGMSAFLLFFNKNQAITLPLTMIIAGATGNVLDFFIYGYVVDMFHFILWGYDFPVFNVADSAITLGIAWLALITYCTKSDHNQHAITNREPQ